MPFCIKCGRELTNGANFCANCGTAVAAANAAHTTHRTMIYDGELHKCPNCGELLDAFVTTCPACNYELRGAKITSRVDELSQKIEKAESVEKKIDLISNFYIPNTKEDIYEFFILAISNIQAGSPALEAWIAKLEQAYQKAKLSFGNTPEFQYLNQLYRKALKAKTLKSVGKSIKKSPVLKCLIMCSVGALLIVVGFFAGSASNNPDSPFYILALIGLLCIMGGAFFVLENNDDHPKESNNKGQ